MKTDPPLDQLDMDEWREVVRALRPEVSDEEFNRLWAEFVELKRFKKLH